MRTPALAGAWLAALLAACAGFARAGEPQAAGDFAAIRARIVSFQLENGLRVILYPRGEAPVVSCVTYVQAGSVDEHAGITGIAHQLEHLAFKGTPSIGTKDAAAEAKVLAEIDARYDAILQKAAQMRSDDRAQLLTLLARLSSGGSDAAPEAIDAAFAELHKGWVDGDRARYGFFDELLDLSKRWAAKIEAAEAYVVQNEYSKVIEQAGGTRLNAFTSADRTVYYVSLPSNKVEFWAALESDRFMNTVPRQLEKEKQVVLEERRMRTETRAFGRLHEAFLGAAFRAHPYGVSVIGHRSDILTYTREKVLAFYGRNYTPRNTVVAIVGRFDVEAVRRTVADYFGRIPDRTPPTGPVTVEPEQDGERRVEVAFPAEPILLLGWHVPERKHPDTPALMVLEAVASEGRSARFYRTLVKTQVALTADAWLGPGERYPRLFVVSAEPSEATPLEALERAVMEEVERLKSEPPTPEELARVVTRYRADVLRKLNSNQGMAIGLADYQAGSGDWQALFEEIAKVAAVTPEQVAAAARKYLTERNRTVARLQPAQGQDPGQVLGVPAQPPAAKAEQKNEGRR